jgi:hypothetical protein
VRPGSRHGLSRQAHDLRRIDFHRSPAARQILLNRRQPALGISRAPAPDLNAAQSQLRGNRLVVQAVRCAQHDLCAARQTHTDGLGSRPLHQLRTLFTQQHDYRRYTHRSIPIGGLNGRTSNARISSVNYEALH